MNEILNNLTKCCLSINKNIKKTQTKIKQDLIKL